MTLCLETNNNRTPVYLIDFEYIDLENETKPYLILNVKGVKPGIEPIHIFADYVNCSASGCFSLEDQDHYEDLETAAEPEEVADAHMWVDKWLEMIEGPNSLEELYQYLKDTAEMHMSWEGWTVDLRRVLNI